MLAGCSSTLLSPRHTKPSTQFQPCHFPSMSTQRLDLPCSTDFTRKDPNRAEPIRPVTSLSINNQPIEARTSSCSLKHNATRTSSKGLKRLHQDDQDESFRAKRKRGCSKVQEFRENEEDLSLGQLGSGNFWYPVTSLPFSVTPSPWSFVNELADLGETTRVTDTQRPTNPTSSGSGSRSSSSPESHQSLNLDPQQGTSNRLTAPNPNQSSDLLAVGNQTHEEEVGFELVSLLFSCLEAISTNNIPAINHFISKLGELSSPTSVSPIARLASYYTEALAIRVSRLWPNIFQITTPHHLNQTEDETFHLLNQSTPIPKFIHFTSNEILLQSFHNKDKIHIIDFDIKHGLQWPSFLQTLSSRPNPPTHVRITGIGESKQSLIETGARLARIAESLNLRFEFHPVVDRLEDLRLWMLHVKEGETVAVNCIFQLHKLLYDRSNTAIKNFLNLIKSTNPNIVILAEQETEHNGVVLETRVSNSLNFYSAIFDCIDSLLPPENINRVKIEESFGSEIRNIIACEGLERTERHVGFEKWWKLMREIGGFVNVGVKEREFVQSELIVRMYENENGNLLKVEKRRSENGEIGGISLKWGDRPLYTVSAWTPVEIAGSSSENQQR